MRNLSNLLFAASLAVLYLSPAAAAEPVIAPLPAIDMHHTSWTAKDGVPGFILDIAQTRDGMLWLASPTGLVRFDGVRFERFAPGPDGLPSSNISAITALRSGGLLIGYRLGGASLWKDNVLHNYADAQGLRLSTVWNLTEDADGRIWAGTARGLYFMDGGERWQLAPASWEAPPNNILSGLVDQRGTLWLRTREGTWYLPRGEKKFHHHARPLGRGPLVAAPDGSVWTSEYENPQETLILLAGPPSGAASAWTEGTPTGGEFRFDRGGGLWRGNNSGIEHVSGPPDQRVTQRLTPLQGYSGESTQSLLEDREGNIWAGTHNGLDRFRPNKLRTLALPKFQGEARAIALDGAGGLWINRMVLPPPYTASLMDTPVPPMRDQFISCLYTDPTGVVWANDRGTLSRRIGDAWETLPLPPEAQTGGIFAIAREPKGQLWISVRAKGIFRWRDDKWYKDAPGADVPGGIPLVITADGAGRVWFGYAHHQISLLENGKLRNFDDNSGLRLGAVLVIAGAGKHIWAGGEKGVAYYDGKRFVPLQTTEEGALGAAVGIVEAANGDLWVHGALGIAHIGAAQLASYFTDPRHKVRFDRLDAQDGLAGSPAQLLPRPSMAAGADGRLWFSTSSSVQWIDPAHIARNNLPPPVMIQAVLAENLPLPPQAGMALPAGTRNLQIDYTATSLTMPERMRFAYRLDGVDRDWKSGEQQRSAHYTNLGPGDYRFLVKASNNDGVWNETGAELPFRIEPTLTQTLWFRLLCGAAGATLLWLAYRLRLRQVARHIHARLDERIVERERIARELHDTLLQAVQGLILHIQAAVLRAPRQEPLRVQVESALQQADDILIEGRERVSGLRASACGAQDLAARLTDMAAALTAGAGSETGSAMRTEVRQTGTPRGVHPIASEEILAIARQALANAVQHSQAGAIVIDLHYGARELRLTIADNGVGLPSEVMAQGGRAGHWGLLGMRERADSIKAKLSLQSAAGAGVQWVLALSAELAYQPTAPRGFRRWPPVVQD